MYAFELFEAGKPRVVVTYPGRFQPFHQGHAAVFAKLQKQFGGDNVFILTSNDTSSAKSPFNFTDKYRLMTAAGVPGDKIIETNNMYVLPDGFDPASTIFVAAVGEPDKKRLNPDTFTKKDKKDADGNVIKPAGSPSYFKSFETPENKVTADQHGYVIVIPEVKKNIKIGGKVYDVSHGTECRNLWNLVRNNREQRAEFLTQLYGSADPELGRIFDKIPMVAAEDISPAAQDSTSPIHGGIKSIAEGLLSENEEFVLYLNDKPAASYTDSGKLKSDLELVKKKYPNVKYEVRKEVCKEMPVNIVESRMAEVAMNPKAFAQSIQQGEQKGVLVGFEFEVLIPESSVNAANVDPNAPQYDPNSTAWLQGKSVTDLLSRLRDPVTGRSWNYIIEDLFKIKNSVASELGTKNLWSLYTAWANKRINDAAQAAYPRWVSTQITKILKSRQVASTPVMYQGEESNALAAFISLIKGKTGIELTPGRSFNARGVTPEQFTKIQEAARQMYYETSRPIDQLFRPISDGMDAVKHIENQKYFRSYNDGEDITQPVESFSRFCEETFGTTDLTELLKTKWAFNGRTNNSSAVLKEKLWYYVTPGAAKPESLAPRGGNGVSYDKGAQYLKRNLEGSFGSNMTIFNRYHQGTKSLDRWYIEPDGSLRPNRNDGAAEVVSPPLPAVQAVNALKTFYQKAQEMQLYTNNSTGLHINVSIPDKLDVLKLALFIGDQHVLKTFGRENNNYARSVIKSLKDNSSLPDINSGKFPALQKEVQQIASRISEDHFATVNFNGKYVSFRHAGGDYLNRMGDIINTVGRFVRAMMIAADPNAYKQEYMLKLTRLIKPAATEPGVGADPDILKKALTNGIPAIRVDAALRPGFTDPNDLTKGALKRFFPFPGGKAIGVIRPDPSARQRMLASRGFGVATKDYLIGAVDGVFYTVTVVPTSPEGLQVISDYVGELGGAPGGAVGLYDARNNRVGVAIENPSALTRKDPNFAAVFQELKGKTLAGPKGVLPEDAAGVGVVAKNKKMAKDPRYSMSITKDVKPSTPKNMLRAFRLAEDISEEDMMSLIKKFLPLAMKELKIKKLPRIILQQHIETHDGQATFGRFVNEEEAIYLGIADRHPVDILRTLAHELAHFKQFIDGKMYDGAGETGSPIENEAHVKAGIIMRHFNKKYPQAIKAQNLELDRD